MKQALVFIVVASLLVLAALAVDETPPSTTEGPGGCDILCPAYVRSVCAVNSTGDRRTFNSECAVTLDNCNEGTDYKIEQRGPC